MPPAASPAMGASGTPAPPTSGEKAATGSVAAASLLSFVGGSLDAFLYLTHGHVFAGAMTGNAVLLGIALLGKEPGTALLHATPIVAFGFGVLAAEVLQTCLRHHAMTVALSLETAVVLAASFLPKTFPEVLFVFLIALVAAFQIASFRKVEEYSYNSLFITGDLRAVIAAIYHGLHDTPRQLRQARDVGTIVIVFLLGAAVSAALADRFGNQTLWLPGAVLLCVLAIVLRRATHVGSPSPNGA